MMTFAIGCCAFAFAGGLFGFGRVLALTFEAFALIAFLGLVLIVVAVVR